MCAAIIRTVRRGEPGTFIDHTSGGRCSMRYVVTRWLVRQAAINNWPSSRAIGTFICLGNGFLTPDDTTQMRCALAKTLGPESNNGSPGSTSAFGELAYALRGQRSKQHCQARGGPRA